jgi:4-aminobutyrate aminotransferase
MRKLRVLAQKHSVIGEIRGKGLMIGMELVTDQASRTPARKLCDTLITRAFHHGLILLSCGQSTVRFMPPLLIGEADVDEAVGLLEGALKQALAGEHFRVSRGAAAG